MEGSFLLMFSIPQDIEERLGGILREANVFFGKQGKKTKRLCLLGCTHFLLGFLHSQEGVGKVEY